MEKIKLVELNHLKDRVPEHFLIDNLDLVAVRYDENVSVLYGRCLHRGALMGDGYRDGENRICGVHGWDYRFDTGVSEYNNEEVLHKFFSEIKEGWVWIDKDEILNYLEDHPQFLRTDCSTDVIQGQADSQPALVECLK